ncbi:MAG: DUF4976 domain-containing protein [Flavobacteriales bacterium]|nr:MAG: DUF4976 domain-containing protein [Flavobacteriales bacterium]
MRSRCSRILFISILILSFFSCQDKPSKHKKVVSKKLNLQNKEKPNVIFIIADDLNCDIGAYGNSIIQTPHIDELSRHGVLFVNAHNQYPLCGPSRASFMTGMYTDQTKMTRNNMYIRNSIPDVITIGQRFRQQGYQSIRIGKIFHYDNPSAIGTSGTDDPHTWDQTVNPYGRDKKEEYKINTLSPRKYGGTLSWLSAEGKDEEYTDGIVASEAVQYLDEFSKTGESFFLAVGFYRPHTPFVAPQKYFELYDRSSISIPKSNNDYLKSIPEPAAKSIRAKKNQINLEEELAKEIKEAYYASISFIDAQIGRILNKLKESGLHENTIVIFTSDHGYHLGEHGHWQKQTLFENSTRVPLIISVPGDRNAPARSNSPVELIDLYPTIMDLAKIEIPNHVVGKSLEPIIKNQSVKVRKNALTRWRNGYSIKTDRYRLTQWGKNGIIGYELYDHQSDREELTNLASHSAYKVIFDSLKTVLKDRIANAQLKPNGLGRQYENINELQKAPNITYGDLHDSQGKRIYLKPTDE